MNPTVELEVLFHLPPQRRHVRQRINNLFEFNEAYGLHLYQGRPLSVEEFNQVSPPILGRDDWAIRPLVKIVASVKEAAENGPVTLESVSAAIKEHLAGLSALLNTVEEVEITVGETPEEIEAGTKARAFQESMVKFLSGLLNPDDTPLKALEDEVAQLKQQLEELRSSEADLREENGALNTALKAAETALRATEEEEQAKSPTEVVPPSSGSETGSPEAPKKKPSKKK